MVKGWRNDPRWVDLYERKKEAGLLRHIENMKAEMATEIAFAKSDAAIRAMKAERFKIVDA